MIILSVLLEGHLAGKDTEIKVKLAKMEWTGVFEVSLAGLHRLTRQRFISKED